MLQIKGGAACARGHGQLERKNMNRCISSCPISNPRRTKLTREFVGKLAAAFLAGIAMSLPNIVNAQVCLHGLGGSMGAFGTNCAGQVVSGVAHAGDTIALILTADYNDQCGTLG